MEFSGYVGAYGAVGWECSLVAASHFMLVLAVATFGARAQARGRSVGSSLPAATLGQSNGSLVVVLERTLWLMLAPQGLHPQTCWCLLLASFDHYLSWYAS